jgi:hypothetical protein
MNASFIGGGMMFVLMIKKINLLIETVIMLEVYIDSSLGVKNKRLFTSLDRSSGID